MFDGSILGVTCPRIAVLGTDGAIGKRTTATILTRALNADGIHAVLVGTGQTSLIQGAFHGVALDAVPAQFVTGELEAAVVEAFEAEDPDVIIVEGQGALSHPTYLSSTAVLRGSRPASRDPPACPGPPHDQRLPGVPDANTRERDQPHRDVRRHEGDRPDDQPREHDRQRGLGGDHALRSRTRDPRDRCADPADRPPHRHGVRRVPRLAGTASVAAR